MKFSRVETGRVSNPEIVVLYCRVGQGPNFRAVRVFYEWNLAVRSPQERGPGHFCGLRVLHQRPGLKQVTAEPHCWMTDPSVAQ